MSGGSTFFEEMKRRNVIRVAVAYLVLSWLLLQVVDVLIGVLGLPGGLMQAVAALAAIGFLPVVIFSWVFEMTPEGLKRESEIAPDQTARAHTTKKLDLAIIGLLVVAIGMFAGDRFLGQRALESAPAATAIADASVAVLPFTNMSAQAENEYFSDGLADTLLHMLAQTPDLRVAARTSSFQFKGQQVDARDVGQRLNVATVLEGSVQRSGDRIRVIAQLIDADTGYHLWSETFDRQLDDIFQVQDEIASHVAEALFAALLEDAAGAVAGSAPSDVGGTTSVAAYEAFMQAQARLERRSTEDVEAAIGLLELATELDPQYGRAWARLSSALPYLATYGTATFGEVAGRAADAAAQAIAVSPELAEAQLAHATLLDIQDAHIDEVEAAVQRALALNPNSVPALRRMASIHESRLDEGARLRTLLAAVERDPLDVGLRRNLADAYRDNGLADESWNTIQRVVEMDPDSVATRRSLIAALLARGEVVEAVRIAHGIREENPELLQIYMLLARIYARLGDAETGIAYMRQAWEIRPDRVHDDLAFIYLEVGDRVAFLEHWADYRAFVVRESTSADLFGGEADLRAIDQQSALVREDWATARALTESLLQDDRQRGNLGGVMGRSALLAGIALKLGDRETAEAAMAESLRLVERSASLGADYDFLDLIRALDAALHGDGDATVGHLTRAVRHGAVADDILFNAAIAFAEFLPAEDVLEGEPVQAFLGEQAAVRAQLLAELNAAFPEPLL